MSQSEKMKNNSNSSKSELNLKEVSYFIVDELCNGEFTSKSDFRVYLDTGKFLLNPQIKKEQIRDKGDFIVYHDEDIMFCLNKDKVT